MNKIATVIKLIIQILPYIDDIIELIELIIKSFKENGKPITDKAVKQSIKQFNELSHGRN